MSLFSISSALQDIVPLKNGCKRNGQYLLKYPPFHYGNMVEACAFRQILLRDVDVGLLVRGLLPETTV